ncbi:helix-turn-helix domain-containing protein [Halostella litorea]|uniref:helix-turn-helix domain-containing protein n=1 Tax=Halostella litorea TaxID=2528831 RepID=UPI001091C724|nr:helix-turn-helix domain-containing protein [Halostella litorea]
MATIASFTVPADAFPLGSLFEDLPAATMELDRIVPTTDTVIPYVWVRNAAVDDVAAAIGAHPDLAGMELVDTTPDVSLYRVAWDSDARGLVTCIADSDASLLRATGTAAEWTFELRGDDADAVADFRRRCVACGVDVTLTRLHTLSENELGGRYGLTPAQREALLLAFEEGYYDDPRATTLQELADRFGISRTAVSARLKRGYRNLIGSTLVPAADGE